MSKVLIKVVRGRITGPKLTMELTGLQKEAIEKSARKTGGWSLVELSPSQKRLVKSKSGIDIDEVFLDPVEPKSFTTTNSNYAIRVDENSMEVSLESLNPAETHSAYKKVLKMPPGSSIHKTTMVPTVVLDKSFDNYENSQLLKLMEFDKSTIGIANWIDSKPRDFNYIHVCDSRTRSKFSLALCKYTTENEMTSRLRLKSLYRSIDDGTYYKEMDFIPFSKIKAFAEAWWLHNSSEYAKCNATNKNEASVWITDSVRDSFELCYQCFHANKIQPFYKRRNDFYQKILKNKLEKEPSNFR